MISYTTSFLLLTILTTTPFSLQVQVMNQLQKETHLHVYLHETFTGPNPTSVTVVNPSTNNLTTFGSIRVFSNELRSGSDPDSTLIGFSQGKGTTASRDSKSSIVEAVFVFVNGKYNGSTLAVLGRPVRVAESEWEVSVVGGTGLFRYANGYAVGRNLAVVPGKSIVVEFHLYFLHGCRGCGTDSDLGYCSVYSG